MPVLTSPPLIGGAGKPVTGRVAISSTHDFEWTDSLGVVRYITQAVQQGVVRDGQFFALESSDPIELIPTPANVAMRIVLRLEEQGASRGEHVTSRTVTVPAGASVAWGALVDVVPPVTGGDYVIPPWASDVITYRDQAGVSATNAATSATNAATSATAADTAKIAAEAARDRAEAVPTSNDTIISGRIADAASATRKELDDRYSMFDVPRSATALADATTVFTSAALTAKTAGRRVLRVAPGTYTVPGIHPDDIQGLYLVGDGVTLTGAPKPNLYPFTTDEWAGMSARSGSGVTGRGVVAFEIDDGTGLHWTRLFPLCKELGITMGTGWHTDNGERWIKEAHRHGWEVISHLPYDADWSLKTLAELEAGAVSSLDAIAAAIGTREGIGFIYPRHLRNPAMDSVLAKYYTRGRGIAGTMPYPRGGGHPWLVTAFAADTSLDGTVSEGLKSILRSVAAQDGQIVLYIHFDNATANAREAGLRELVPFIRALGMDIRNPGQVWGATNILPDPYDERTSWTLTGATRSAVESFKGGTSVEFGTASATVDVGTAAATPRPGMFTVMRLSARVKTSGFTVSAAGWGLSCAIVEQRRTLAGTVTFPAQVAQEALLPTSGTSQAALDWSATRRLLYLQPATVGVNVAMKSANVTSGSYFMDEVKLDLVDYVPQVSYVGTLNGTTVVGVITEVPELGRCRVVLQPLAPVTGRLSYAISGTRVHIKSSDATDTAQVRVVLTPGDPYDSMAVSNDGA